MTNFKKKRRLHWTSAKVVIILCAAFSIWSFSPLSRAENREPAERPAPAPSEPGTQLPEDQDELRSQLAESQRQLERVRRLYAELYLENKALLDELTELRLQAANLLGRDRERSAEQRQAAALQALREVRQQHEILYRQVHEFGDYLQTVLSVMQPSQALRREIERKYGSLQETAARMERMPSIVAWRGGDPMRGSEEARVLKVEEALQVVILSAGEDDYVRLGSTWRVVDEEGVPLVTLRVVEIRAGISAAIPVRGDLSRLVPGMRVEQESK